MNELLFNPETSVTAGYFRGWNHLSVKSPSKVANSKLLNEPMIKALILGIIAGIICRFLPEGTRGVLLDGIAAPLMSTVVGLLMGIMGPVFFLFIIAGMSSLESLDDLTRIGKVIIRRFVIICTVTASIQRIQTKHR